MDSYPVYHPIENDQYLPDQYKTPVKASAPPLGFGNSSSPAFESPRTVGLSDVSADWTPNQINSFQPYGKRPQSSMVDFQVQNYQVQNNFDLESSPPDTSGDFFMNPSADLNGNSDKALKAMYQQHGNLPYDYQSQHDQLSAGPMKDVYSQHIRLPKRRKQMHPRDQMMYNMEQQRLSQQNMRFRRPNQPYKMSPLSGKTMRSQSVQVDGPLRMNRRNLQSMNSPSFQTPYRQFNGRNDFPEPHSAESYFNNNACEAFQGRQNMQDNASHPQIKRSFSVNNALSSHNQFFNNDFTEENFDSFQRIDAPLMENVPENPEVNDAVDSHLGLSSFLNAEGLHEFLDERFLPSSQPSSNQTMFSTDSGKREMTRTVSCPTQKLQPPPDFRYSQTTPIKRLKPSPLIPSPNVNEEDENMQMSEQFGSVRGNFSHDNRFAHSRVLDQHQFKRNAKPQNISANGINRRPSVSTPTFSEFRHTPQLPSPLTPSSFSFSGNDNESSKGVKREIFSSKVFALACEKQKSLNDVSSNTSKGPVEKRDNSRNQFFSKGKGLMFSINQNGFATLDAISPKSESSKTEVPSMKNRKATGMASRKRPVFQKSNGTISNVGFDPAQKLLDDSSDSETDLDQLTLQTPPRFSSLGDFDATTAFARTLSRGNNGPGSTFLFPENMHNKQSQENNPSSYSPYTPREMMNMQESQFIMQTPPGAICNYDLGDYYGTGMTPYVTGNTSA